MPHEIDEEYFYCVWDKPRAGKQQKQLHRVDPRKQMGVVELIQFVRQYTEPLARKADPPARTKLFLYFSENTLLKNRLISSYTAPRISFRRLKEFRERHQLPNFAFPTFGPPQPPCSTSKPAAIWARYANFFSTHTSPRP